MNPSHCLFKWRSYAKEKKQQERKLDDCACATLWGKGNLVSPDADEEAGGKKLFLLGPGFPLKTNRRRVPSIPTGHSAPQGGGGLVAKWKVGLRPAIQGDPAMGRQGSASIEAVGNRLVLEPRAFAWFDILLSCLIDFSSE